MHEYACRNVQGFLSIKLIMPFKVFFQWQFIAVSKKNDFCNKSFVSETGSIKKLKTSMIEG